jgi:hypothetical protein
MMWPKRVLVLSVGVVLAGLILGFAYVAPILTTEIDPNLGRPECPGGKDWDLPGSSCHNGMIADYFWPTDESPAKEGFPAKKRLASIKRKRGH